MENRPAGPSGPESRVPYSMLRISVITPSRNQGQFIQQALDSVRQQAGAAFDHLVVDSDSSDGTPAILDQNEGWIHRLDRHCRNLAEAFNWGLQHASGDIVGWLNADDIFVPNAFGRVLAAFRHHPEADVIYGACNLVDERDLVLRRWLPHRWSIRTLDRNPRLWPPAVFFRRRLVERVGDVNEQLSVTEDHGFWLRLAKHGAVFRRIRTTLAGRRVRPDGRRHGNESSERRLEVAREWNQVLLNQLGSVPLRSVLEEAQAETECEGLTRWDSVQWDRQVLQNAMAIHRRYNGSESVGAHFRGKLLGRHVRKEFQQCLRRPRNIVRFLPAPCREFSRRHLSRKIFTMRYLEPEPVKLPARYYQQSPPPDAPLISVVTPNLNQGQYLEATLRSVLDQNYPRLEFVVQDGGSSDDSVAILRQYDARLTRWESAPDRGQSDAINRGMRHTTGEIMAYLNSDDLLLPGSLAYIARYFRQHDEVDVVYGHRLLVDERGDQIGRWILPPHDDKVIAWADFIPQETMFWRRRAWERVGSCIDDSFSFAMDWDLILRFRDAGLRFARLPRFLGAFRITEQQKTSQLIATTGAREMARLRYRVHGSHASNRKIRRMVRPYIWRHWVYDTLYTAGLARY